MSAASSDPGPDEAAVPPEALQDGPARYGFGSFLTDSWALLRAHVRALVGIFVGVHVVAALVPFLFFFRPDAGVALPVVFLIRVVIPVALGSLAVALVSPSMIAPADPTPSLRAEERRIRAARADLVAMCLLASMAAVVAVIFLGAYGFLILPLFYGPPIAMQILSAEGASFGEAMTGARVMLKNNWRTMLYLFNVSLGTGLVAFVLIGGLFSLLTGGPEPITSVIVAIGQGAIVGSLAAFLAAGQNAIFLRLRGPIPAGSAPVDAADEPAS